MWHGKDTPELIKLKEEYEKITGYTADGEMDLDYDQSTYADYVNDLKTCIEKKITLGDLYADEFSPDDGWF